MKGSIRLSSYTSNQPPYRGVTIRIEDASSSIEFLEVELTFEQLGRMMTGSSVDCDFELRGIDHVGKVLEVKTEVVILPDGVWGRDMIPADALKPYEVDGWKGREGDLLNHHNRVDRSDKNAYRVVFSRYVDAPAKEQEG